MEKQENKQTTAVSFDNLKKLNSLLQENKINNLLSGTKECRKSLDSFCKSLREKSSKNNTAKAVEQSATVAEVRAKVEPIKDVADSTRTQSSTRSNTQSNDRPNYNSNRGDFSNSARPNYRDNGNRPNYQNNRNGYQGQNGNRNGYQGNNYQDNGSRPNYAPRGDSPYNGDRPYNQNGPRPYNNGQFGDRQQRAGQNGYVARTNADGTRSSFAPRGDRPFNSQNGNGTRPNFTPRGDRPFNREKTGGATPELDTLVQKNDRVMNKPKPHKPAGDDHEKKALSKKDKFRIDINNIDEDDATQEVRMGRVRSKVKKAKEIRPQEKTVITNAVITTDNLTVKILSEKIGRPAVDIVKKFMLLGMMLNINSPIDYATAELVASEFGVSLSQEVAQTCEEQVKEMFDSYEKDTPRPPIVTVMGHVDHGKTSLLDYIKKTNVIAGEAGGITQHIGAYSVKCGNNKITFIDTPGHAAFSAMRARGAEVTDIAVLVVAADDGVMPQTIEAIKYIKESNVPMVVAINKMDKPEANIEKIKQELTEYNVVPEEWGGDAICVPISAKFGTNIDKLLESILLVAEVQELKASYTCPAQGTVIESKVDKGRGITASIIVNNGTLKLGDFVVCGLASGRIRAMVDYVGNSVKTAEPSMAVSVLGLDKVPDAGDIAYVVDEKFAKSLIEERLSKIKVDKTTSTNGVNIEDFLNTPQDQVKKKYNILIKADVNGSAEALKDTLGAMNNEEVEINVIDSTVGAINETDVLMAQASGAVIIGFNVKPDAKARLTAERNAVAIKFYKIIYEAVNDLKVKIDSMITPKYTATNIGKAEVRHIFKISGVGIIAGCYMLDGEVNRTSCVRVLRNDEELADTKVESLQQGKDNVKNMKAGFECGIKVKDFADLKEGDILQFYELV